MQVGFRYLLKGAAIWLLGVSAYAATFGTSIPIVGTPSDISLDERRSQLYVANFSAQRVEVYNTLTRSLDDPLEVPLPPSSVTLSPDNRFLIVGQYENVPNENGDLITGHLTIFDLDANQRREVFVDNPVLSVEFGNGGKALVVTTSEFLLVEPFTGVLTTLQTLSDKLDGTQLPVAFLNFPQNIVEAATGVSGDGNRIVVLAQVADGDKNTSALLVHDVGSDVVQLAQLIAEPPLGPRAISASGDGNRILAGWALVDFSLIGLSQFPAPTGDFRHGSHAWDSGRDLIYADIPVEIGEDPVMHVMDTDNLAVRERIQIPETLTGRSIISSDGVTMYSMSDSGVVQFSLHDLETAPRVVSTREDVLFEASPFNDDYLLQAVDLEDPNGGQVDFSLSLSGQADGIQLSQTSGTTPARIFIKVDPAFYRSSEGTNVAKLEIASDAAINLPMPVRLLINTATYPQQGQIVNIPGKLVDILADPARDRIYVLRQDKDLVLMLDSHSLGQITTFRTGNTPTSMAMTTDRRYLLVGHDDSQHISVFDLETLEKVAPIDVPGAYPRVVATGNGAIWTTARVVTKQDLTCTDGSADNPMFRANFEERIAMPPDSLGVFCNQVPEDSTLRTAPGGDFMLLANPDGTVALWDSSVQDTNSWVLSRKDLDSITGTVGALSSQRFLTGDWILSEALTPLTQLDMGGYTSSGSGVIGGGGLLASTNSASGPGRLQRVDLSTGDTFKTTALKEAPLTADIMKTPPIGQIGETILPLTRTVAIPADQSSILVLSVSGILKIPTNFDDPVQIPTNPPNGPTVVVSSVTNAADGGQGIAPGGLVKITGKGFADAPLSTSAPFPLILGDTTAEINGTRLALMSVSSGEIVAQLPYNITGAVTLIVRNGLHVGAGFPINIQTVAPAIFRTGQSGTNTDLAAVLRAKNNDYVAFTNPIHPNDVLMMFLTGMGAVNVDLGVGQAAPYDPFALVEDQPVVTLGEFTLEVAYAGLVPGMAGVYQINVIVPDFHNSEQQASLKIQQGEVSTSLLVRMVAP